MAIEKISRLSGLSLRFKLACGFATVIVLTILVGVVSLISQQQALTVMETHSGKADRIAGLSAESNSAMQKARQHEKDFYLKVWEYGFSEARVRYLTLLRARLAEIRRNMVAIRGLVADPEVRRTTEEIERAADRYERGFTRVVDLYGVLGKEDTGLEGKMRRKVHRIEGIVRERGHDRLLADLLGMRRAEKDYLLRGGEEYVRKLGEETERFRRDLALSGVDRAMAGKLHSLANDYLALFSGYVRGKEEIKVEMGRYLAGVNSIEPLLERFLGSAQHDAETTSATMHDSARTTLWTIIFASLCAALVGLSMAVLISRSITRSVGESIEFAGRIAQGDLDTRMSSAGKTEFATLAAALNAMADALQYARLVQEHREEELAEANRALEKEVGVRKEAEQEVRRLNEELEAKVEERTKELLDAQEELVRKEKLSTLGQLSGSVGHELRNPLGVMNNAVYFLQTVLADGDETTREYLGIIKKEIDNSQRIIADLLDFARTTPPQARDVTAGELVEQGLGKCMIPECIALRNEIPEALPPLRIDPLQMGQVLQNLITNAVQAMPDGGALTIAARLNSECGMRNAELNAEKEHSPLRTPHSAFDGDFIEISVSDTGEGISPENMKRLFQPLFTTKARGIGLGLVVCRNLTEANGGRIEVESRPGEGTTFSLMLPAEGGEA